MADGGRYFPRVSGPRRSPPRNERRNWSPPRGNFRGREFDRRDGGDRFGRDARRDVRVRLDGPLMTESQFHENSRGSYRYEDYKIDHRNHNAKIHFEQLRKDETFIERYHPTSIIERRKRDAAQSQQLSIQYYENLENDSFVLPNYDADAHPELFPDENKETEEPEVETIEIEKKEGQGAEEEEEKEEGKKGEAKKGDQPKKLNRPELVPAFVHERIGKDLELAKKLAHHFDVMRNITTNILLGKYSPQQSVDSTQSTTLITSSTTTPLEIKVGEETTVQPESFTQLYNKITSYTEKQQLDLFILYLSMVHFHSYYTCSTFPSQEKHAVKDVYRSSSSSSNSSGVSGSDKIFDETETDPVVWSQNFEKKIQSFLSLDLQVASGERRSEELIDAFYKEKIVKDSPERFRCSICTKMFKGPAFVKKHISVKHPDKLEEIKEKAREEQFYRNYLAHCDKVAIAEEREKERERRRERSPRRPPNIPHKEKDVRERRISISPQHRTNDKRPRSPRRGGDEGHEGRVGREGGRDNENKVDNSDHRRHTGWRGRGSEGVRGGGDGGRGGRGGRGFGRFGKFDTHGETFEPPPEFRDKIDPRSKEFVDLDQPKEESFEIDYEKALAAFAGEV